MTDLDIARRRRAWHALRLGPLWVPVASALPGARFPEAPEAPAVADTAWDETDQEPMLEPVFDDNWERDDGFGEAPAAPGQADAPVQPSDRVRPPEPDPVPGSASAQTPASVPPPVPQPEARTPAQRWEALRAEVSDCQRCPLADTRTQTVFGRGRPGQARWLLIGEAPGAEEDRQGEAFVGQAGQLLDAMLRASGIDPSQDVFIANVLKCRPPGNRNPEPDEVAQCEHFLHEQIRLSNPDCILLLGRFAAQSVLHSELPIGRLRNKVHYTTLDERRIPVVVTYHPAYLLRNMQDKLRAWEDLCLAASVAGKADDGHTNASQPPGAP